MWQFIRRQTFTHKGVNASNTPKNNICAMLHDAGKKKEKEIEQCTALKNDKSLKRDLASSSVRRSACRANIRDMQKLSNHTPIGPIAPVVIPRQQSKRLYEFGLERKQKCNAKRCRTKEEE